MDAEVKFDVVNCYKQYFYTKAANTDELKEEAYRLRYKVYLEELSYYGLNTIDHQEKDEFDKFSLHSLLFHKESNQLIGCTRLVPFINDGVNHLPFEKYCKNSIELQEALIARSGSNKVGELSRLIIAPEFRCRQPEWDSNKKIFVQRTIERRRVDRNFLPVCITIASINLLLHENINYAFALMEPRLVLLLKRFGLVMEEIGSAVNVYGERLPYLIDAKASFENFVPNYKVLFSIISEEYKQT